MRGGWEGNARLQDAVRRADSPIGLVAEVRTVDGRVLIQTSADWAALTVASGSASALASGGIRITASESTLLEHTTDDSTDSTNLTTAHPFDALIITHLGAGASSREFHTLTARLDPRANGGNPKTVDHFIAELFRISRKVGADEIHVEPIGRSDPVTASGEVAADFDFTFQTTSGRYPTVGDPFVAEEGASASSHPETLVRIVAYQSDGSLADNVSWLSDSAQGASKTDSSTYSVTHYSIIAATRHAQAQQGATVWENGGTVSNMPRFSFTRSSHSAATIGAAGDNPIADISGTGSLTIVARGEEWGDSSITWEIYDGSSTWYECVDGDIIGQDNTETLNGVTYGNDLSAIPTTGPWDLRVTLTPSTGGLRSPVARDFGIERIATLDLAGVTEVRGGARTLDLDTLIANIPKCEIDLLKTGERDFRDYGSLLLSGYHIGDIEVALWVGDPSGTYLHRSEWMLHSVWEIEDYRSLSDRHTLVCVSPLRVLTTTRMPPFVVTSGNDGTREAILVSGTRKAVWASLADTYGSLPARFRGPGVEDTTNTVSKYVRRGTVKEELDRVAFLGGDANIESQGRLKAVKVMRDEPVDYIVAAFPIGSYTTPGLGPGFSGRIDEYFVRYNYEESDERFEDERRYLNATAITKLGGPGIDSTRELDEEAARWITTQALADAVGDRVPKYFGNGRMLWPIEAIDRNPQLEQGDVVTIEADLFVARSPINDQAIRGRLTAQGVVANIGDMWGQRLDVWIPGFEYIALSTGTTTLDVGPIPVIYHVEERIIAAGARGDSTWKRALTISSTNMLSVKVAVASYIQTWGIDSGSYPSTTIPAYNYTVDTSALGELLAHVVKDSVGAEETYELVWDEYNLLPGAQGGRTITLTPYSQAAGAGVAGRAITLSTRSIPDYENVVRVTTTRDRRIDNNDVPGVGGQDLDMDNTANGFAFSWTNNEGASVDISKVRFYLKATGSPTGNINAEIYSDSSGLPGTALSTSALTAASSVTGTYAAYDLDWTTPYTVSDGTTVHIAVEYSAGDASNYITVEADDAGSCSELNGSWAAGPADRSLLQRLYIEEDVEEYYSREAV